MAAEVEFCLLGPLLARRGALAVPIPPGNQRTLLAALLLNANRVVSLDELAETLWGSGPPASARPTLQNYVKRLRKALAGIGDSLISTQPLGYVIRVGADELDVFRFEALHASGREAVREGAWDRAAAQLGAALSLWRGEALEDVPSELLAQREVPRLAEMRLQAVEARIDADLHLGRHADVIAELRRLAGVHPLRERLHALLMLALYRDSQQAEALAAYQHARRLLIEELGAGPGSELRQMEQQILIADPALATPVPAGRRPALGPAGPQPGQPAWAGVPQQLPAQVGHFVGRASELKALTMLLDRTGEAVPGTVVISAVGGTAGVGKTALAVHWAHQVADRFPDGQLYVNLGGFGPSGTPVAPADAVRRFLDALCVPADRIPSSPEGCEDLYRSLLADRRMLVVLDNARDAAQVRPLLPGGPGCLVMVTSRSESASLVVAEGAHLLILDVLSEAEARELLVQRIGPERIAGQPETVVELAELCARLPLALAIAAARAAIHSDLPIAALIMELRDAAGRLDALDAGEPASSMRAVLSSSYDSLSRPAARMFRLLGVHPGPDITIMAAASLAGIPLQQALRLLRVLTRAHLLAERAPGRFAFHDLLYIYAAERAAAEEHAADCAEATRRILAWYLHSAAAAARVIDPNRRHISLPAPVPHCEPMAFDGYDHALAWLDAERANLVAAVSHAARIGAHEMAWKLPIALWDLFNLRSHWADWIVADQTGLASARFLHDQVAEGWILNQLAVGYQQSGQLSEAMGCFRQALNIRRALGDRRGEAAALANLGRAHSEDGRLEDSMKCLQQSLSIFAATGQRPLQARVLIAISGVQRRLERYEGAMITSRQAVDILAEVGDRDNQAGALTELATACRQLGRLEEAIEFSTQAAELSRDVGDRGGEAEALVCLGQALSDSGRLGDGRKHWRDARAIFEATGDLRATVVSRLLGTVPSSK